jgi:TPR repeat protein
MKTVASRWWVVVVLSFACGHTPPPASPGAAAGAPSLVELVFRPGPTSILVARLDPSWKDDSTYHAGALKDMRFLREAGAGRSRAKLLVTPMATMPDERFLHDPGAAHAVAEQLAADMAAQSVEKHPAVEDTTLGASPFSHFTVTDAHPKAGEFPLATQGVLVVGGIPCSVTLLHDDLATRAEVFAMLARWSTFGAPNVVAEAKVDVARVAAACRRGDALACGLVYELSGSAEKGPGADERKMLEAGCKGGSAFACGSLGSVYAEGHGVPKDEARAKQILARGCDAHGSLACVNAMAVSRRGQPDSAPLSPAAVALLDRACGYGGDRDGVCRFSSDGDAPAATYLENQKTGCARGDGMACRLLGWAIETGYGTPVDVGAARAAYAKSCDAHNLWGCFRQALLTADAGEQARLYEAACAQGSGPACYGLAQPAYGRAAEKRRALLRQACESSIEEACADVLADLSR